SLQNPPLAERHGLDLFRPRQRGEHDLTRCRDRPRAVRPARAPLKVRRGRLTARVVHRERVPGGEDVRRHGAAHVAQSDKADTHIAPPLVSLCCFLDWATAPPSTDMACPVTKDAASEHSHTTASAISSGFPIRPTGSAAAIRSAMPGRLAVTLSTIGVWITPGHTAFTRTPDLAYSNAAVRVNPTTPCLLAT